MRLYILPYFICIGIISLTTLMLTSCTDRHNDSIKTSLSHIDTLMFSNPDSALSLLDRLPDSITDCEIAAWRDFLTIKTLDKAYQPLPCDSIIAKTVAHYANRGDSLETQSLYYYGYQLMLDNRYDKALVTLYQSFNIAKNNTDHFYTAMSARAIANIYSQHLIINEELKWTKITIDEFIAAGKTRHALWSKLSMVNTLLYNDNMAEAILLIDSLKSDKSYSDDPLFKERLLITDFDLNYNLKNYSHAIEIANDIITYGYNLNAFNTLKLANCNLALKNYEMGELQLKEAQSKLKTRLDTISFYSSMSDLYAHKGSYHEAYAMNKLWATGIALDQEKMVINPVIKPLTDYYILETTNKIQETKLERTRFTFITISITIAFIIIGFIIYKLTENKINRQKIVISNLEHSLEKTEILQRTINRWKSEYKEKSIVASRLVESLNELCKQLNDCIYAIYRNHNLTSKYDLIFNSLTAPTMIRTIEDCINITDNNWMKDFRENYPGLLDHYYEAVIWHYLGFSVESMVLLMKKNTVQQIHNLRFNIKAAILKKDTPKQFEILKRLGLPTSNVVKKSV